MLYGGLRGSCLRGCDEREFIFAGQMGLGVSSWVGTRIGYVMCGV